ncbi:MAG: flagellar hook-length control protein FliK [Thiobacillus sp.]|nr:flagellar hook-length control protein FliK [Thiobacillus sp.]
MFPVHYVARILDVPPALDAKNRAVSNLIGIQPIQSATERDQTAPRSAFADMQIGQTVVGQVKSLTKGLALVEIDGQTVAMRLPPNVASGDTLRLRFSGHMPQPVFLLELPNAQDAEGPQLSNTARMLSDIMHKVPERALPTLTPAVPLLGQAGAAPAELAFALRAALVRSGLFYESHLANWVAGQDSLDGLMQEPQNRQLRDDARNLATVVLGDPRGAADAKSPNPMHVLLTQQLQVLESPQLAWRGELWPGQSMEWQIRRDGPQQDHPHGDAPPEHRAGWESHLKLDLPNLGTLNVYIKLDADNAFSVRLLPELSATGAILQRNQARLGEQLAAAGCSLQSLKVEHDVGA